MSDLRYDKAPELWLYSRTVPLGLRFKALALRLREYCLFCVYGLKLLLRFCIMSMVMPIFYCFAHCLGFGTMPTNLD